MVGSGFRRFGRDTAHTPHLALGLFALVLGLAAASPSAAAGSSVIDFDGAPNGADAATLLWPGVTIGSALVLDEATIEALTLHEAVGSWATSGSQGLFNSLAADVIFLADGPFESMSLQIVGLPRPDAGFFQVEAQLWSGDDLVDQIVSDGVTLGDSGLHEATLMSDGFIADRLVVRTVASVTCGDSTCLEPSELRDTLFLDDLVLGSVPEPGVASLLGMALLGFALRGRAQ